MNSGTDWKLWRVVSIIKKAKNNAALLSCKEIYCSSTACIHWKEKNAAHCSVSSGECMQHCFYFAFLLFWLRCTESRLSIFPFFTALVEAEALILPSNFGMCDYGKYLLSILAFTAHMLAASVAPKSDLWGIFTNHSGERLGEYGHKKELRKINLTGITCSPFLWMNPQGLALSLPGSPGCVKAPVYFTDSSVNATSQLVKENSM